MKRGCSSEKRLRHGVFTALLAHETHLNRYSVSGCGRRDDHVVANGLDSTWKRDGHTHHPRRRLAQAGSAMQFHGESLLLVQNGADISRKNNMEAAQHSARDQKIKCRPDGNKRSDKSG